ncbi:MAG: fumarylacetoacetate hydrolase family protein [Acidimicrobiales bacterium]
MRLATVRADGATRAVRVDDDGLVEIGPADVGELLRQPDWRERAERANGRRRPIEGADLAPLVPRPDKIVCVGLNYRNHIAEMAHDPPDHPTLFAKFTDSLIGANDDIVLPAASDMVDWEAELAVVIGTQVRHAGTDEATAAIAGFSVLNDVSVRDWQRRTQQWLQGKTFESTTPLGPHLAVREADETADIDREIVCEVDGQTRQKSTTGDVVFPPSALVAYVSTIITLRPGDVIATGTPGGVGAGRTPPVFLNDGDVVVTRIAGVGECRNACRKEGGPTR